MDSTIPSAFQALFLNFSHLFTTPSFSSFVSLVTGWLRCTGRRTISRVIQVASGPGRRKHHSTLYRFLSQAVWVTDGLGKVLFELALPLIPGEVIHLLTDDTLCRRSGPHLFGGGMHHDALRSTYGRGSAVGRQVFFAFGHNWVVLAVWVPLPWNSARGLALPVLFRLYRSKKRCPKPEYRKRTDLATDLIKIACTWIPEGRRVMVVADAEYACQTLLRGLPPGVNFTGPINMNAAFYSVAPPPRSGRGRPRRRGARLPSPKQLAANDAVKWRTLVAPIYGREVSIHVKTQQGLWYRVTGDRPVNVTVTRDPKGRIDDRAYFTTDTTLTTEATLNSFSKRWSLEVTFRDTKQHLGIQDPQNGWWRRRHGSRRPRKKAGPQAHAHRGSKAVEHTVPFVFLIYSLIAVWYFQHGNPKRDVKQVRLRAPWYGHKRHPSFEDMLRSARHELWAARILANPRLSMPRSEILRVLPEWLLAA